MGREVGCEVLVSCCRLLLDLRYCPDTVGVQKDPKKDAKKDPKKDKKGADEAAAAAEQKISNVFTPAIEAAVQDFVAKWQVRGAGMEDGHRGGEGRGDKDGGGGGD